MYRTLNVYLEKGLVAILKRNIKIYESIQENIWKKRRTSF